MVLVLLELSSNKQNIIPNKTHTRRAKTYSYCHNIKLIVIKYVLTMLNMYVYNFDACSLVNSVI